jgi:hypothetical protein
MGEVGWSSPRLIAVLVWLCYEWLRTPGSTKPSDFHQASFGFPVAAYPDRLVQ